MERNKKSLKELDKELYAEIQERIVDRQISIQEKLLKLNLMEMGILYRK